MTRRFSGGRLVIASHNPGKLREIAELLDCAEGTVKKHLFTAVRKLREELYEIYC